MSRICLSKYNLPTHREENERIEKKIGEMCENDLLSKYILLKSHLM